MSDVAVLSESKNSTSRLDEYFSKSRSLQESLTLAWSDLNYSIATKDSAKSTMFKAVYKNKVILRYYLHGYIQYLLS
jgi:hypothetical protein